MTPHGNSRVLCFGDSLTAGYCIEGQVLRYHPYAHKLEQLLPGVSIDHVGLSGWTSCQMVESLDGASCVDVCKREWKGLRRTLHDRRYTHCVILAGTNDVSQDSPENIFKNICTLASVAISSGCLTFVMSIPELVAGLSNPRIAATRDHVNNLLLSCNSNDYYLFYVFDLAARLPYSSASQADRDRIWGADGLHLRKAGYDAMAEAVADLLTRGDFGSALCIRADQQPQTLMRKSTELNPAKKARSADGAATTHAPPASVRIKLSDPENPYHAIAQQLVRKTVVQMGGDNRNITMKNWEKLSEMERRLGAVEEKITLSNPATLCFRDAYSGLSAPHSPLLETDPAESYTPALLNPTCLLSPIHAYSGLSAPQSPLSQTSGEPAESYTPALLNPTRLLSPIHAYSGLSAPHSPLLETSGEPAESSRYRLQSTDTRISQRTPYHHHTARASAAPDGSREYYPSSIRYYSGEKLSRGKTSDIAARPLLVLSSRPHTSSCSPKGSFMDASRAGGSPPQALRFAEAQGEERKKSAEERTSAYVSLRRKSAEARASIRHVQQVKNRTASDRAASEHYAKLYMSSLRPQTLVV